MAMALEASHQEAEHQRAAPRPGPPKYPQEVKDFAGHYARTVGKSSSQTAMDLRVSPATSFGWMHAGKRSVSQADADEARTASRSVAGNSQTV